MNSKGLLMKWEEVRMRKRHAFASTLKSKEHVHAVLHSHFIGRPLLFINSDQHFPKVVDLEIDHTFFPPPHKKEKKSNLGMRLGSLDV